MLEKRARKLKAAEAAGGAREANARQKEESLSEPGRDGTAGRDKEQRLLTATLHTPPTRRLISAKRAEEGLKYWGMQ